jgi:thiosulfate dehydrogenase
VSCHLENGTNATALPWLGTTARYPRMRGRSAKMETMAFRINDCITRSLAGQELAEDSQEMRDMIAYLETLGSAVRPPDADTVQLTGHAVAGQQVYTTECARCHGNAGEGAIAPALWGADSYSIGAGMARQWTFATFVRHNMPVDRPGTLTDQQAADVAAYVLQWPRQDYPEKEADWPKGNPPVDAAYPTDAAKALGKPMPPVRPVLPRRVAPHQ